MMKASEVAGRSTEGTEKAQRGWLELKGPPRDLGVSEGAVKALQAVERALETAEKAFERVGRD